MGSASRHCDYLRAPVATAVVATAAVVVGAAAVFSRVVHTRRAAQLSARTQGGRALPRERRGKRRVSRSGMRMDEGEDDALFLTAQLTMPLTMPPSNRRRMGGARARGGLEPSCGRRGGAIARLERPSRAYRQRKRGEGGMRGHERARGGLEPSCGRRGAPIARLEWLSRAKRRRKRRGGG